LSTVGALVSLALERTRLAERGATLAAAEERNRIARDIHDTIAQSLAAIAMNLESADALLETPNPPRASDVVRRALNLTRSALEDARRSVMDLRSTPLAGRGLMGALRALPDEIAEAIGTRVPLTIEQSNIPSTLPASVEMGVYHITREALTNIARHAKASSASLQITDDDESIHMRICDDGSGFDVANVAAGRFGLLGMRERARLLGGELTITTSPGGGTVLDVDIPLSRHRTRGDVSPA
jgi:two-component system NarL family sensor kinase